MRPASVIWFERLYLAAIIVSLINTALSWSMLQAQMAATPGVGMGFVLGAFAISTLIQLLLWFLTARRRSNVAKWILIVLFAFGLLAAVYSLAVGTFPIGLPGILGAAGLILQIGAVASLFRPDALRWFYHSDIEDVFE